MFHIFIFQEGDSFLSLKEAPLSLTRGRRPFNEVLKPTIELGISYIIVAVITDTITLHTRPQNDGSKRTECIL